MTDIQARLAAALADRYRLERALGAGGMATVYLAEDLKHDRRVAIKVLKPELAAVLGAERFVQEIKTTAALSHPHILPLFDSGEADGFLFYVMPYIAGETIRDRLNRETQLGIDEAVRITREIADALDYAHRHGVIHRDIKPENLLLHDGRAMVMDFGIALAVSAAAGGRMTETGLSLGTPHYMSPEQATADKSITARSDVYSLASVCYEMLTGNPPHVGSSAQQIIMKIIAEPVQPVTALRKSVPPNVAAALAKALEKVPADRFDSAKEFAAALQDAGFSTGLAGAAAAVGASGRRPARWMLPAVAVLALLLGTLAGMALGKRGLVEPQLSRQRVNLWQGAPGLGFVALGVGISPDGQSIAYADTVGGSTQLWVKERDWLEATPLTGTEGARVPTFSPDGQWIAFFAGSKLKKVPRVGGSAVTIADLVNLQIPALAWLDDGTLAYNDPDYSLVLVGQDGGPARRVIRGDSLRGGVVSITALAGGKILLLGLCDGGCVRTEVVALDLRSAATPSRLADDALKAWALPGGAVVFVRRDGGVFSGVFDPEALAFSQPPIPVLNGVGASPFFAEMAVGRNGTLLYAANVRMSGRSELVWLSRDGTVSPVDSGWSFRASGSFQPALSPDGRRLAVSLQTDGNASIWIKELTGNRQLSRLTVDARVDDRPVWMPDGRGLLYVSRERGANVGSVVSRRADGALGEVVRVQAEGVVGVEPLRDSTQFIVRLNLAPMTIALHRDGVDSLLPLLGDHRFDVVGPAVSPDGRWLAYASNETGRFEVYVRPFPNVGDGRWSASTDGGTEPRWAHSGRELFYRDSSNVLTAAQLGPGSVFSIERRQQLFSARSFFDAPNHHAYVVAPEDDRFLFTRFARDDATGQQSSLVMVENWFKEIDALLRGGGRR